MLLSTDRTGRAVVKTVCAHWAQHPNGAARERKQSAWDYFERELNNANGHSNKW